MGFPGDKGWVTCRGISMEISPASVAPISAPTANGKDGTKTKALREEVLQYRRLHTPSDRSTAPPSTLAKIQPAGLGSLHLPSCLRCLTFELPPRLLSSGLLCQAGCTPADLLGGSGVSQDEVPAQPSCPRHRQTLAPFLLSLWWLCLLSEAAACEDSLPELSPGGGGCKSPLGQTAWDAEAVEGSGARTALGFGLQRLLDPPVLSPLWLTPS